MSDIAVKTVKTDKFELEYFSFGNGTRSLVIIPGMSVRSVMFSADAIAAGFADFTEDYTAYCIERRNNIPEGFTVFDMAEDTAEAMKILGIADADIFGASMGAMMAMVISARHPELVHKAVFASVCIRPNDVIRDTMDTWRRLAEEGDVRALNRDINARVYSPEYVETYKEIFDSMLDMGEPEELRRFAVYAQACKTFDFSAEVDSIPCPVLATGSRQDRALSFEGTEELGTKPFCQAYIYDGFSHAVYDEDPAYRGRMLEFFRQ